MTSSTDLTEKMNMVRRLNLTFFFSQFIFDFQLIQLLVTNNSTYSILKVMPYSYSWWSVKIEEI